LKPLGKHVMLIGLKQPLKAGETLPLTLVFEKQGDVAIKAKVGKAP
jgi:periplasmic copper chaperone A